MKKIKVILVDDHAVVRAGYKTAANYGTLRDQTAGY